MVDTRARASRASISWRLSFLRAALAIVRSPTNQKLTGLNFQRDGELLKRIQTDIALSPLHAADVGSMEAASMGQFVLRNSGSRPQAPNILSENGFKIAGHERLIRFASR